MRVLIFALCLPVLVAFASPSALADDDRTATYGSPPPSTPVIYKSTTPQGDTKLEAKDNTSLNPLNNVREGFNYGSDEDLNEASKSAVLKGDLYTTRTTEERRDSVPRVQELGF